MGPPGGETMHVTVITGASMGIGEEFARQLAARRHNLLLIARSEDRLRELAADLEQRYGITARVFPCDLAREGAAARVHKFLVEEGIQPAWLINNAGFGLVGTVDSMEPHRLHDLMMLNVVTLVDLTRLLLPMMRLHRDSRIINVASTAAFQPIPFFAAYAASKTFVLHFSEALSEEMRGTDVKVLALCPGPTPTNFHVAAEIDAKAFEQGQSAAEVVRLGLLASDRGRAVVVTQRAWANLGIRILPRLAVRFVTGMIARKMLKKHQA